MTCAFIQKKSKKIDIVLPLRGIHPTALCNYSLKFYLILTYEILLRNITKKYYLERQDDEIKSKSCRKVYG